MTDLRTDHPFASARPSAPCGNCRKALGDPYWTWQRHAVCASCRDRLTALMTDSQSAAAFGKAALQGAFAALVCGVAYAVFVAVTNYQLAFATIGIAYVIAKVVRGASRGVSGVRYQVLAVALTYFASTMGYVPALYEGLKQASHDSKPVVLLAILLAAPFLELSESPLGAIIVAIGLWQAWKQTRGVPTAIDGPFRSAAPETGAPR
jgi:hypothetical protein